MYRRDTQEQSAKESHPERPSVTRARWCEIDISLAARCESPVLITAPPDDALAIARLIATLGRGDRPPSVLTCDPTQGDDVTAALAGASVGARPDWGAPVLLLREVQSLGSEGQAALTRYLLQRQFRPLGQTARLVVSSSESLFEYVERGAFDEGLYYRLSAIHIVGSDPPDGTGQLA
jgi:hypothetical protein